MSIESKIEGHVFDNSIANTLIPIECAEVTIYHKTPQYDPHAPYTTHTDSSGKFSQTVSDAQERYTVFVEAFGVNNNQLNKSKGMTVPQQGDMLICLKTGVQPATIYVIKECEEAKECPTPAANRVYEVRLDDEPKALDHVKWTATNAEISSLTRTTARLSTSELSPISITSLCYDKPRSNGDAARMAIPKPPVPVIPGAPPLISRVALQRAAVRPTGQEDLWTLIRANEKAIGFNEYREFINRVLCQRDKWASSYPTFEDDGKRFSRERSELVSTFGVGVYELLRTATELFLILNCRVSTPRKVEVEDLSDENSRRSTPLPDNKDITAMASKFLGHNQYILHVIEAAFPDDLSEGKPRFVSNAFSDGGLLRAEPCLIELIWSYWHEESMLTQSVQAIVQRFQNHHASGPRDPLAHFEMDPLRPLNNILWGYIQNEYRRLTIPRRALEYSHQYGLTLYGKANPGARSADPRSKFLESFHNLLHRCSQFFKEDNDTTVIADGFPLLNALREVFLVLAQGAHNQFGDLPWTARVEMLIEQWIMARGETRDFLQSRAMVPYTEAWMPQVDTMKTVQSWTDISVSHFHDLGTYGEEVLLSVRYGDWVNINDEDVAKNWARYWRPEIQSYLHAYRAVAGIDLTNPDTVDYTVPGLHLQRRLEAQSRVR